MRKLKKLTIGPFLLVAYSFFMMLTAFGVHGAASEEGKLRHQELQILLEDALSNNDTEALRKIDTAIRSIEWALTDPITKDQAHSVSVISGAGMGFATYAMFWLVNKKSANGPSDIGSSKLFLMCVSVGALFIFIYEMTVITVHPHIAGGFYDSAVAMADALTITMVLYFQILTTNRLSHFKNLNFEDPLKQQRYLKSVELENKTWTVIFQSLAYAVLFLFVGVFVGLMTNVYDVATSLATKSYTDFLMYQAAVVGLVLFGYFFGILGKIIWYLGRLSDILGTEATK